MLAFMMVSLWLVLLLVVAARVPRSQVGATGRQESLTFFREIPHVSFVTASAQVNATLKDAPPEISAKLALR
jgi:hypothetical protein